MKDSGKSRKKLTQALYPRLYLSVVHQVENGEMTYKQMQKAYCIKGRYTVLIRLRKLGTLHWSKPISRQMTSSKETPAQKIKCLERAFR